MAKKTEEEMLEEMSEEELEKMSELAEKLAEMEFEYPTIARRTIAGFIDAVIVIILLFAIGHLMSTVGMGLFDNKWTRMFGIICIGLYFVLFECSNCQGTLGKLFLGIEILNKYGVAVYWRDSFGRTVMPVGFGFMVLTIISDGTMFPHEAGSVSWLKYHENVTAILFLLANYSTIFFSKRRMALLDMLTGSHVVMRRKVHLVMPHTEDEKVDTTTSDDSPTSQT